MEWKKNFLQASVHSDFGIFIPNPKKVFYTEKEMNAQVKLFFTLVFLFFSLVVYPQSPPIRTNKPQELRNQLIDATMNYLGTPYVLGGVGSGGLDCSGLVNLVYFDVLNQRIPRTVKELHAFAQPIERWELEPGDLVFFSTDGPLTHVGVYMGNNTVVHAASQFNRSGAVISRFDRDYYQQRFSFAGRFLDTFDISVMNDLVNIALNHVGAPYVLGGSSPWGVDCSGLITLVYREAAGIELPRTTALMVPEITPVPMEELLPGDLLFFNTTGPNSHVGMYLGGNQFIHAASEEIKNGVIYSDLLAPYYRDAYHSSGRILPTEPVPWVRVRSNTGLTYAPFGLETLRGQSDFALYYNSLGPVDLGIKGGILSTSFVNSNAESVGLSQILLGASFLLNDRTWFDARWNVLASGSAPLPDLVSTGTEVLRIPGYGGLLALGAQLSWSFPASQSTYQSIVEFFSSAMFSLFITTGGQL